MLLKYKREILVILLGKSKVNYIWVIFEDEFGFFF